MILLAPQRASFTLRFATVLCYRSLLPFSVTIHRHSRTHRHHLIPFSGFTLPFGNRIGYSEKANYKNEQRRKDGWPVMGESWQYLPSIVLVEYHLGSRLPILAEFCLQSLIDHPGPGDGWPIVETYNLNSNSINLINTNSIRLIVCSPIYSRGVVRRRLTRLPTDWSSELGPVLSAICRLRRTD